MAVLEKKKKKPKKKESFVGFKNEHFVVTVIDDGTGLLVEGLKSGGVAKLRVVIPDHLTVSAPENQEVSRRGPTTGVEFEDRLFIKPASSKK